MKIKLDMKRKEAAVIGQGIAGLMSALRLVDNGYKVTIISPQNKKDQASWAALGLSTMKGLIAPREKLFEYKMLGHHQLKPLIEELQTRSGLTIPHTLVSLSLL